MFTKKEYEELRHLVFQDGYLGYRPDVKEIPNGDGKVDVDKRYAHVAMKYLETGSSREKAVLFYYLVRCHSLATKIAVISRVPDAFLPSFEHSALRILEYPPGSGSNQHRDFDLFTLMCYRDQPDKFVVEDDPKDSLQLAVMRGLNPQIHLGEIATEIGLGTATLHEVFPSEQPQHSAVYFAIPDHAAVLPSGVTVGSWLKERLARSRVMEATK